MMNKILLLTTLSLALLTSCSTEEAPAPDTTTPDANITTPDVTPDANPETALDDGEPAGPPMTAPEGVPHPDDLYVEEFYEGNEVSTALAEAIVASRDEEANMYVPLIVSEEDPMSDFILPMLGFTPEDTQGFALGVSAMNVQAYAVVAVVPAEGQEDTILQGLEGFKDLKIKDFTNYLADQLEIAETSHIETLDNGTIVLVMCANQDEVLENLKANLS